MPIPFLSSRGERSLPPHSQERECGALGYALTSCGSAQNRPFEGVLIAAAAFAALAGDGWSAETVLRELDQPFRPVVTGENLPDEWLVRAAGARGRRRRVTGTPRGATSPRPEPTLSPGA